MMETQQQALLGILGGMGPLATVDFLGKLTRLTPATRDQDHLPWVTVSQPGIPDRSAAIKAGNDGPGPFLIKGAAWLATQGTKLIAIPCNTSHFWFEQMQAASSVPILHIADATIEELQRNEGPSGAIAILATRGTVQAGIYSKRLQANGFDLAAITEDEQSVVDQIIKDVKGGHVGPARDAMRVLLQTLADRGVKTAILGCTELPIAHIVRAGDPHSGVQAIDTSLALATVSLRRLGYL
jgi:aspartate racemase